MSSSQKSLKLFCFFMCFLSILVFVKSVQANDGRAVPEFVKDELIIKFKPGVLAKAKRTFARQFNLDAIKEYSHVKISSFKIKYGTDVLSICEGLKNDPRIEYAEPNYIVNADATPNDPRFSDLWGLHNTGQTSGTPDADIDAPEAWDITTGDSSIIVGVIDTGVDYTHNDLSANMWVNPGEIANGIDDDANGYVDDIYGIDAYNSDGDPFDDHYHGTHVAGTIGAKGNNSVGVVGVNWNVKIMALKFLGAGGSGSTSGAIECLDYVKMMKDTYGINIRLTNNSWGGGGFSSALKDAIEDAGILFVAAAGNSNSNNDSSPHYPSNYTSAEVLSVASTDHFDSKSSFSSYGATSVDLGAPGSSILSTYPGNSYTYLSGTSMASPHVAGVAALVLAVEPGLTTAGLKSRIMSSVDPIAALSGITVTGGRLNAFNAVTGSTGTATVSGQVTDIDTGNPINGARVALLDRDTRDLTVVRTDSNGDYEISVPPASNYALGAFERGYVLHKESIGGLAVGDNLIRNIQLTPKP